MLTVKARTAIRDEMSSRVRPQHEWLPKSWVPSSIVTGVESYLAVTMHVVHYELSEHTISK